MTSRASADVPHHGRLHLRAWEWWLAVGLALAAVAFGSYGLWIYEAGFGQHPEALSVGYHTLQLFALHAPHLEHQVPWQLNVGRWLAAAVVMGTVARGLWTVFRSECRLFRARLQRGHIVICGLGRLGSQLAREFRLAGQRVIAIEAAGGAGDIATAEDAGVAVITGDACSPATLRRAAVGRASKVIAVCDDEQKNVAIAAAVGQLLQSDARGSVHGGSPLECSLFITDPRLRRTFQQTQLFPHTGSRYHVNVRGLDLFELAARQVLRKVPLDHELIRPADTTVVHLFIVGFGSMGRHLALQAAKIGHFANSKRLRITVLEQSGSTRPERFLARHPKFTDVCDFAFTPLEMSEGRLDPETVVHALPRRDEEKELVTVAICWDSPRKRRSDDSDFLQGLEHDDPTNLPVALALARNQSRSRVLVFQTRKIGFGALFPATGRAEGVGPHVHAFGMLEDTWSLEALLHEREDTIAKVLHGKWYDQQIASGRTPGSRPALFIWDQLRDHFKDSNRRAADQIWVKMRALGYRVSTILGDQPSIPSFTREEVDLLAPMEHSSWCAEWLLQGYSFAPGERDDVKKTQPYLVPWGQLDEKIRDWDRDQIRAIPEALTLAGYGIYPQVQ